MVYIYMMLYRSGCVQCNTCAVAHRRVSAAPEEHSSQHRHCQWASHTQPTEEEEEREIRKRGFSFWKPKTRNKFSTLKGFSVFLCYTLALGTLSSQQFHYAVQTHTVFTSLFQQTIHHH